MEIKIVKDVDTEQGRSLSVTIIRDGTVIEDGVEVQDESGLGFTVPFDMANEDVVKLITKTVQAKLAKEKTFSEVKESRIAVTRLINTIIPEKAIIIKK